VALAGLSPQLRALNPCVPSVDHKEVLSLSPCNKLSTAIPPMMVATVVIPLQLINMSLVLLVWKAILLILIPLKMVIAPSVPLVSSERSPAGNGLPNLRMKEPCNPSPTPTDLPQSVLMLLLGILITEVSIPLPTVVLNWIIASKSSAGMSNKA